MTSFGKKIKDMTQGPQAQRLVNEAKRAASDPKNREKVSLIKDRLRRRKH